MANKVTKKDMFNAIKAVEAVAANPEMVAFIDHELELLAKKANGGTRKPTATQVANEGIKDAIKAVLADGKARTISEIIADGEFAEGTTTQKISALCTLLIKAGEVAKTVDKKKSYFSLVEVSEDSDESEDAE
jgi:hypothetical protein